MILSGLGSFVEDDNGVVMNHFTENPDMIVGSMEMVSGPYGMESTCVADTSLPFEEQLEAAFSQISGEYEEIELELSEESTMDEVIPAIPEVKNFSYTLVDEKLYYRENSRYETGGSLRGNDSSNPWDGCHTGLHPGTDTAPVGRISGGRY